MNNSTHSLAVRVEAKASGPDALDAVLRLVEIDRPKTIPEGSAVVEVRSSGVNPSDVKAMLGGMPHAVWPRTPGRDFAGVVVEGPKDTYATVRLMVGATNPAEAAPGTIRGDYGIETTENLVHGSDSPASATREIGLFFPDLG